MSMFAVEPKRDCPHVARLDRHKISISRGQAEEFLTQPCDVCADASENWLCLECLHVFCSRYVKEHMVEHNAQSGHVLATSFSDLSTWCYECDSYIVSPIVYLCRSMLYIAKFGELPPETTSVISTVGEDEAGECAGARVWADGEYPDPKPIAGGDELPAIAPERQQSATSHVDNEAIREFEDSPEVLRAKAKQMARYLREAKHGVVYTGAGISTSANIPDYRGPKGVWTMKDRGLPLPRVGSSIVTAQPTFCHMALASLVGNGNIKFVVSTNVDGLHRKSGIAHKHLSELHGNMFQEKCAQCGVTVNRLQPVRANLSKGSLAAPTRFLQVHGTGRTCECGGAFADNIIHFGEAMPINETQRAVTHSERGDLALVLGTSMRVSPACDLPSPIYRNNNGRLVIVNLQKTPFDQYCALRVWGRSDDFMQLVMEELGVAVPPPDPHHWATQCEPRDAPAGDDLLPPSTSFSADASPASASAAASGAPSSCSADACGGAVVPDHENPDGFVDPSRNCPHVQAAAAGCTLRDLEQCKQALERTCGVCNAADEMWVCVHCSQVLCGRSVAAHMVAHGAESGHNLVLSLADLSFWCYACDSYVTSPYVAGIFNNVHVAKFGEDAPPLHGLPME